MCPLPVTLRAAKPNRCWSVQHPNYAMVGVSGAHNLHVRQLDVVEGAICQCLIDSLVSARNDGKHKSAGEQKTTQ
jgi:hypothetical protein